MHDAILKKMEEKISESAVRMDEVRRLSRILCGAGGAGTFGLGVVTGRLYNAFYYQSRRILGRDPTREEFEEFAEFLRSRKLEIESLW